MKLIIDSSVYISALIESDLNHEKSRTFMEKIASINGITILVPRLVVVEVTSVLNRFDLDIDLHSIIAHLESQTTIDLNSETQSHTIKLMSELELKTSDLIIAASADLHHATLISWDKTLIREACKVMDAIIPSHFG